MSDIEDKLTPEFLELLTAPGGAGGSLKLEERQQSVGDSDYVLVSADNSKTFPVVRGVPRFVESDQYAENFSYEWTVHRTTQLDDGIRNRSERDFACKTGWTREDLTGKRVLDVGCGMGRFADVALRWGAEVVGIDLSFAVDAAYANLGSNPNFRCLQASVFDLPFEEESFDFIYSIGVLHHTPDCERAFKSLTRFLKPGGQVAIWLYSAHTFPHDGVEEIRDHFYRRFTTKMESKTLYKIFQVLCKVPLRPRSFWHMVMPGFIFHAIPRLHDAYDDYQWRILDAFDWYSPDYQSKHSYPEVCRWFRDMGLTDIIPLDAEVAVQGRKPA